jgi:hypothetical protein
MTQEEISLLLRDLCARLPYGVICQVDDGVAGLNDGKLVEIDISKELVRFDADYYWDAYIDDVKPYLRSMSSITEEEKKEYHSYCDNYYGIYFDTIASIDWLNKKMFAYRTINGKNMFELGLAVEAPNGMYDRV